MSKSTVAANGKGSETAAVATPRPALRSLDSWMREIGRTPTTVWRWRKAGWIQPVNICGRLYLTDDAINAFVSRAQAGEFSQVHKVPARAKESAQ